MATHRKPNHSSSTGNATSATSATSASSASNQYHSPAITALPQTNNPQQILAVTHPELVEAVLTLYDSHYSDEQFDEAMSRFSQHVEFMDPGLHLYNRLDMKAQFTSAHSTTHHNTAQACSDLACVRVCSVALCSTDVNDECSDVM